MKIINNNTFSIMYDMEFLKAGEIKEISDKNIIKLLLSQPNVEEYADIKDIKAIEEENKKLKEQLEKQNKTNKTNKTKVKVEEPKKEE